MVSCWVSNEVQKSFALIFMLCKESKRKRLLLYSSRSKASRTIISNVTGKLRSGVPAFSGAPSARRICEADSTSTSDIKHACDQ